MPHTVPHSVHWCRPCLDTISTFAQDPLTYNGDPVYVGHTHGLYLYHYKRQHLGPGEHESGWCLSDYLGSGAPKSRFNLTLPSGERETDPDAATKVRRPPNLLERLYRWRKMPEANVDTAAFESVVVDGGGTRESVPSPSSAPTVGATDRDSSVTAKHTITWLTPEVCTENARPSLCQA